MQLQECLKEQLSAAEMLVRVRSRLEPMTEKAAYIREQLPEVVQQTVEAAELAYNGMLQLPGTGGVREFIGNPPVWLERRHNDNEFLWQLNRMTHWQELLEAYSLTGERKYGQKVIDELLDWIEKVPITKEMEQHPIGWFSQCHPLRALELGIRCYKTWPLILEHLGHSDLLTDEVLEKYMVSVYMQIKLLRRVSPLLWPKADHNHFLMECLGVLTTALYFPEFKEAEEWKQFAIDGIERCSEAQLTEDGGQIEGCPSYHNGCMFWFGLAAVLAARFGFSFSQPFMERFRHNLDYSIYSLRPTGKCVPVGDSNANHLAVMGGIYGFMALNDMTWVALASNWIEKSIVREEALRHIWRAPDIVAFKEQLDVVIERKEAYHCDKNTVFWNRTIHQAIIRSGWEKEALSFLFTCRAPIQNFHAHIDLMSFDFTALGKDMIGDPGIFCYRDDEDRKQFKSSNYHSTVLIDERDQFEYLGSFNYGPQKKGEIYNVQDCGFYQVASAEHENYEPIIHRRHIALVDNKFLAVVDELEGLRHSNAKHIQRYFHLDFTDVNIMDNKVIANSDIANLAILTSDCGESSLLPGRMSDVTDVSRDAIRVRYEHSVEQLNIDKAVFLTLLIPYYEDAPQVSIEQSTQGTFEVIYNEHYHISLHNKDIRISK
ncbi:alginate lyase family protein [Paenibacillus yanchengensis]|uniref:Alginate lyase family protein n=1 Tax=Paenibacillus yanchengensis TaxID=2035833 RepID=A0ABW4YN18_9BACL